MKHEFLLSIYRCQETPPGKKNPVRVRVMAKVRLGLGLGLGSGFFFSGRIFPRTQYTKYNKKI